MRLAPRLLVAPFLWFSFFVLIPLIIVIIVSLAQRGPYGVIQWAFGFHNYLSAFNLRYSGILIESLKLASLTSLICLILGVLIAWAMATADSRLRSFYVMALALPFLTNLIIRIYAIRLFVGVDGPLQTMLTQLGVGFDSYAFTQNRILVLYGMVTTYLPFMVFPLYGAFEKFDFNLVEAAQDLGANSWQVFFKVLVPNLKTAMGTGLILVFVPALGEYVIPDLLGGAKNMLLGNLITEQFLKSRDWPMGSALSVILMVILLLFSALVVLLRKRSKHGI